MPSWILFKNANFNTVIDLYTFLNKSEKEEMLNNYSNSIELSYDEKSELFKNMFTIVRKFRNSIAHNYKIIGYKINKVNLHKKNLSKIIPADILNLPRDYTIGGNDMFSMILSLIMTIGNKVLFFHFIGEILNLLLSNDVICRLYLKKNSLPSNLKERLEKVKYQLEQSKRYQ